MKIAVLKGAAEWWLDRIQAWVHYVPIKVDYSDLYDTLAYVRYSASAQSWQKTRLMSSSQGIITATEGTMKRRRPSRKKRWSGRGRI